MKKLFSVLITLGLIIASYVAGQQSMQVSSGQDLNYTTANRTWDLINNRYLRVDEIDTRKAQYGLAKGLVNSLGDQYSSFFDPQEADVFMTSLAGDLQGIGAELTLDNGVVKVVSPLPDSPAEKAGIRPGDMIVKVDDQQLGLVTNLYDVVFQIRGQKGTTVVLTVYHSGNPQPVDISIVRDEIHLDAVSSEMYERNGQSVAVVTVSMFTENIGKEFKSVLKPIIDAKYDKLVLDLRFNGGGYLEGAIDMLSYFFPKNQPLLHIRDLEGVKPRFSESRDIRYVGDLVVLINGVSASASEIVAGALQDTQLAYIMGTKSYGKGSVQEVYPFSDDSLIKITIAEWLTPNKRSIEGAGIVPDQIVDLDYDAYLAGNDNQLEASLEYLTN